jgi:hypothetical protein
MLEADVGAELEAATRPPEQALRRAVGRLGVVADRGMISAETIAGLEERGLTYILGGRARSDKLVREVVLADEAPVTPLVIPRRARPDTELAAKAVTLSGLRTVVCRNREEATKDATKDAADRQAILASLQKRLARGDKAVAVALPPNIRDVGRFG